VGEFREIPCFSAAVRIEFGEFTLDWEARELSRAGTPVHLSPKALELLKLLVEHRPGAVAKATLHARIWPQTFVSDATLTSLVAELRGAIGDRARQGRFLRTVHGHGYAFCGTAIEKPERRARAAAGDVNCWVVWSTGRAALREGENILGRDRHAAVWCDGIDVSRRHARISIAGGQAILEDLASKNGTFVGGERIRSPRPLVHGDEIRVGSLVLTFRTSAAEASTASQPARGRR
jgi:DNA-binding winged helix-turn-helix (wHTH) protein